MSERKDAVIWQGWLKIFHPSAFLLKTVGFMKAFAFSQSHCAELECVVFIWASKNSDFVWGKTK